MPLLEVKDLATHFFTQEGVVKAVDGISYQLDEGEVLGVVGESGCGKSVSALSIMRLVADPPGTTRKVATNYARLLRAHFPDDPALAELEAAFGPDIGR